MHSTVIMHVYNFKKTATIARTINSNQEICEGFQTNGTSDPVFVFYIYSRIELKKAQTAKRNEQ